MTRRYFRQHRACLVAPLLAAASAVSGCRSAYVEATVHNGTGGPISLLEVDYPSASFGTESMAGGADFRYRFKILGNGATKVSWTDAGKLEHSVAGPDLHEGEEGHITVTLTPQSAMWDPQVRKIH